jgi:hypothetical protein
MSNRNKISLDDLKEKMDSPASSQELDKRLAKIEMFISKFDTTNMMMSDEQMIYFSSFNAALQGLSNIMPNYSRRPEVLYNFLSEAQRVARCAVAFYRGGGKAAFLEEHSKQMSRDEDA